jgi:hypothetical protein
MLKKFLILIILFFSSSLINGANCCISVTVESSALIKIVNGEEALIGIPSTLHVQEETIYETVEKGNIIPLEVEANKEFGIRIEPEEQGSVHINLDNYQVDKVIFYAIWNNNDGESYIINSIQ